MSATLHAVLRSINVKPLKIGILENLEENPVPQHGCVKVGSLLLQALPSARLSQCPWGLRFPCRAPVIAAQKGGRSCWLISSVPEEWPGEYVLAYVLLLNLSGFFCCCCLKNKFLAVNKTTRIGHFIELGNGC